MNVCMNGRIKQVFEALRVEESRTATTASSFIHYTKPGYHIIECHIDIKLMCITKPQSKLQHVAHFSILNSILLSEKRLTALLKEA